jgi:hypothetical protein
LLPEFVARPFAPVIQELNLVVLQSWLKECEANHPACKEYDGSWYPTRLLHFEAESNEIRVITSEDHSPTGPYITLSHRWTDPMKLKLTSATMAQYQLGIQLSDLPSVFRDAVQVCQYLDISYLWIDALCILQDEDQLDWDVESQNMYSVYSHAYLNISASSSLPEENSLFRVRDADNNLPSRLELDSSGELIEYFVLDSYLWPNMVDQSPLNNRGWVYQERFLARRVIHFGQTQLAWECRHFEALEMFPRGLPRTTTSTFMSKPDFYEMLKTLRQNPDTTDTDFADFWQILVTNYARCDLTRRQDRSTAFEGIVKAVATRNRSRCVAGVWEHNLEYDLAWSRIDVKEESYLSSGRLPGVPSWSWIGVEGAVSFPALTDKPHQSFVTDKEISTPDDASLSKVPFIRLQGCRLPFKIHWHEETISDFEIAGLRFPANNPLIGDINFDGLESEISSLVQKSRLFFLPLVMSKRLISGILLEKIRGVRTHRRVGAVEVSLSARSDTGLQEVQATEPNAIMSPQLSDMPSQFRRPANALKLVSCITEAKQLELLIY